MSCFFLGRRLSSLTYYTHFAVVTGNNSFFLFYGQASPITLDRASAARVAAFPFFFRNSMRFVLFLRVN